MIDVHGFYCFRIVEEQPEFIDDGFQIIEGQPQYVDG